MKIVLAALMTVVGLAAASTAAAHKVIASVFVSGRAVEGEVGFSNGEMAENVVVQVFDADGQLLGETTTDSDGFFVFTPTQRIEHVFRADLGAGHVAEARMTVDELPRTVGADTTADRPATDGSPHMPSSKFQSPTQPAGGDTGALSEAQREVLAQIVRDEMRPLRREIAAYKEKNDLQTILGGIGYIIGLFGIGFYLAARRKLRQT